MTLTPAYGRDYKSAKAAKADYNANLDFILNDFDGSSGLINKAQIDTLGPRYINIRYSQLRKVTVV